MTNEYNQAYAWAAALTFDADNAVFNWRFIHDQDKGRPAIKRRGTLAAMWNEACNWNRQGYGIFATVNEMDGSGYDANGHPIQGQTGDKLENVAAIRAHVVDLDNLNAMENLQRASLHNPAPWFYVQTSPGKAHVYWPLHGGERYRDNEANRTLQRKLRQFYDGDRAVVDATRVLRVPGFYHLKGLAQLVTCAALPGYGHPISRAGLVASMAHVNAPDDGGGRHPLGDPELAAPSAEWLWFALDTMPVDGMSHPEFISFTAAFKQAGWTIADPDELKARWLEWAKRFGTDSKGVEYNLKHWDSIQDTEVGFKSLMRQNVNAGAHFKFYGPDHNPRPAPEAVSPIPGAVTGPASPLPPSSPLPAGAGPIPGAAPTTPGPVPSQEYDGTGELMHSDAYMKYFEGCTFVTRFGEILDPKGQLLNSTQFNGAYGGPRFIIAPNNVAPTDEPWKAATRSFFWTIPKVDYMRFLPHEPPRAIILDELERKGVNTYKPAIIRRVKGDPSRFFAHLDQLIPDKNDQKILLDFISHNANYPGFKIPWAPLIQSAEGAGKGVFKSLFSHLVGSVYFHSPNAKELTESGSKFNGWMRRKLFILVDEIRTDERRDMIEVLKPWISEKEIEVQGKGDDQEKEDNYSNWAFFSNYKDAVPINQNSRRFAIFYSPIQSAQDLRDRGMDEAYFTSLYNWFDNEDGGAILADWFTTQYVVERGKIPMRAPETSSHSEAVKHGRTATERAIMDAIETNVPGFRGGWVSSIAAEKYLIEQARLKPPSAQQLERTLETLGFHCLGRSTRLHFQESNDRLTTLFARDKNANPAYYSGAQGYGA